MSTRWSFGGSVLASLCCAGPAVAALIGVGSASALVGLSRYRWPLLVVGLLIAGAGVFLTLRQARATCPREEYQRRLWQVPLTTLAMFAVTYGVLTYAVPTLVYRSLTPQNAVRVENPTSVNSQIAPAPETSAAPAARTSTNENPTSTTRYRATLRIRGMT